VISSPTGVGLNPTGVISSPTGVGSSPTVVISSLTGVGLNPTVVISPLTGVVVRRRTFIVTGREVGEGGAGASVWRYTDCGTGGPV